MILTHVSSDFSCTVGDSYKDRTINILTFLIDLSAWYMSDINDNPLFWLKGGTVLNNWRN